MEGKDNIAVTPITNMKITEQYSTPSFSSPTSINASSSQTSPSFAAPRSPPPIVLSPCAACKILRRRCVQKCVLAPFFPPTEPQKFVIAHRVFGASNIIKFLQELPKRQRADAVTSMVYEANARIRDPVYGCAGVVCHLQKQVSELQAELAKAQAELATMQSRQQNLISLICMEMPQSQEQVLHRHHQQQPQQQFIDTSCFLDEYSLGSTWEPLWT